MLVHDGRHDRQAEAGTGSRAGVVGLPEPVEGVIEGVTGETVSVVSDHDEGITVGQAGGDLDRGAARRVPHGVADEVGDRLAQVIAVA